MDPDPELSCAKCTVIKCIPPSVPKITAPLLEVLNDGKLANVVISLEELNPANIEEGAASVQQENGEMLEKSIADVIDILYAQKDRLKFTLQLMCETNKIIVNRADLRLVEDVAAVEHVVQIDGDEVIIKKKKKMWKRFKNVMRSKK